MAIKNFDNQNLKVIRADINDALRQVAEKHGIDLSIGTISFASGRFTTRLTATVCETGTSGLKNPLLEMHGFNIGDTFQHKTKIFKVVGYNPRRPKNCIELQDQNGKKFSTTLAMVKMKLQK